MGRETGVRTASGMALGFSGFLLLDGVALLVVLPAIGPDRAYCENIDHPGRCTSRVEMAIPGGIVTAAGAWCVAASVGWLRRRSWGRWAVVATFSLWALAAFGLVADVVTAPGGVDPGDLVVSILVLAYFATIVLFALETDD